MRGKKNISYILMKKLKYTLIVLLLVVSYIGSFLFFYIPNQRLGILTPLFFATTAWAFSVAFLSIMIYAAVTGRLRKKKSFCQSLQDYIAAPPETDEFDNSLKTMKK